MPGAVFVPAQLNDLGVDVAVGTPARGAVLYRGAAKWNALAAGTSGQVLTANGAGADPSWQTPASGVTDHGALTGLSDDDHSQYIFNAPAASARNLITSAEAASIPLSIRAHASQSAAMLAFESSAGTDQAGFDSANRMRALSGGLVMARAGATDPFAAVVLGYIHFDANDRVYISNSATAGAGTLWNWGATLIQSFADVNTSLNMEGRKITYTARKAVGTAVHHQFNVSIGALVSGDKLATFTTLGNELVGIDHLGNIILTRPSTTAQREAGAIESTFAVNTDASRQGQVTICATDFNARREGVRVGVDGTNPMIGFLGAAASARTAITGSRGGNAALASLLTELATKGLITDSTSA